MSNLPKITLKSTQVHKGSRNDKGQLCNIYTPLLNFVDSKTQTLGDFTTELLNFDMEHPVDIIVLDAYDGGVNLILNDNKNKPRLINSRFSVQNENTFKVTDHIGFKDSNIYTEESFNTDTLLKQIPIKIPVITYKGLKNNGGKLPVGSYTFYFKLVDTDGNETEVIAESGIVQCHIGDINTPTAIRMGMQDENSTKSIMFTLSNLDPGFSSVRVLFERRSSASDLAVVSSYHKILFDYSINSDKTCFVEITGTELIVAISKEELYVDYADINAVQTLTVANNILLFGNTKQTEHNWEELKRISWKIIPTWELLPEGSVGALDSKYLDPLTSGQLNIDDHGYCYYNTKNVYNRVGYWPGEIYRFGIVYIFEDNSLSPVLNIQGIDFNLVSLPVQVFDSAEKGFDKPSDYSKLFFMSKTLADNIVEDWLYPCHLYDTEDGYFNNLYRTNSKGVIRFPDNISVYTYDNAIVPKPLYIKFDLSLIGYERAHIKDLSDFELENTPTGDFPNWQDVLKKHNIKGFFFVRQKRIPMTIAQGVIIGLTDKDHGALPILQSLDNKYIGLSFLGADRLLYPEGTTFKIPRNKTTSYMHQAMLVPDAELHQATFNQLFTSQEYCLERAFECIFNQNNDIKHYCLKAAGSKSNLYLTKLTNVPDGTRIATNGVDFFAAQAGSAEEAFKTEDLILSFNRTVPQDLTTSTSLVRGLWGSYVGLSNPNYNSKAEIQKEAPFRYGEIYNIKTKSCYGSDIQTTDLPFLQSLNSLSPYFAISHRTEAKQNESCFRGDCFVNMYTHRMNRNFIDPELPTNDKIVNPDCWALNYAVRCTSEILGAAHSNMTNDNSGWYIGPTAAALRKKELRKQALIYFLTGNLIGGFIALSKINKEDELSPEDLGVGDSYINPSKVIQSNSTTYISAVSGKQLNVSNHNVYYKLHSVEAGGNSGYVVSLAVDANTDAPIRFDANDNNQIYPNGYANEIVQAFEMYVGPSKRKTSSKPEPNSDLSLLTLKYDTTPSRKKVNPKELEQDASGFNLKTLFKSDENWELHGVASINRADVNAVGLGQWITFPIMSSTNLEFRDLDYQQATEETKFNKKRSFYPLLEFDLHNPLPDSNVINGAASCCLPGKSYHILPKTPFFKLEYFTRIYNSFRDSSNSVTNQFRLILLNAYEDYTKVHGSITKLVAKGNYVYIIFTHGLGVIDMGSILNSSALDFLPPMTILNSDLGSMWKDSIIDTSQGIFGVDSVAKKIWNILGTNVTVISDMKVQKFLNDNLEMSEFLFRPYIGHINIKSHYNKFKEDVMFTYYNDVLWEVSGEYKDDKYTVDSEGFIIQKRTDGKYERVVKNEQNVKALKKLLPEWDDKNSKWSSYSDLINLISSQNWYKWQKGVEWSLCYNLRLGLFVTFYDWIPLESENIDNIYFSFDRDGIDYLQLEIYTPVEPKLITLNKEITSSNIAVPINKHTVDKAFTDLVYSYHIKSNYQCKTVFAVDSQYPKTFVCYLQNPTNDNIFINLMISCVEESKNDIIELEPNKTLLFIIPESIFLTYQSTTIELFSEDSYIIIDPKFVSSQYVDSIESTKIYISEYVENLCMELYDFRNSNNSLPLWKHGQAGVYDNQGEIKPTNWYGKLREFNFEFVVNDSPLILKIFNNLLLISNKTEPNKFEYEIVGQGYEWWPYKAVVFWANYQVNKGKFTELDHVYNYILTNDVVTIRSQYPDFPETVLEYKALKTNTPYKYKKLPYLAIELTDRQGRLDRSYNSYDKWSPVIDTQDQLPRLFDYTFNTNETVIKYDKLLNEYRIHDEQLGNDMWKYGRVRGNMQYLEDLWKIEIRPLAFQWCYLNIKEELEKKKITETRHRDKHIKIKIRYSGEELAVILAVGTLLDESRA